MAVTIYKFTSHIHWDNVGVAVSILGYSEGGVSSNCDLTNYYTRAQLQTARGATINWANIDWTGKFLGVFSEGTATVSGTLMKRGGGRASIYGLTTITGFLRDQGHMQGDVDDATGGTINGDPVVYYNPGYVFPMSVTRDINRNITFVNDSATPGSGMYYGTNGAGAKGWYSMSAGVDLWTTDSDGYVTPSGGSSINVLVGSIRLDGDYVRGGVGAGMWIAANPGNYLKLIPGSGVNGSSLILEGGTANTSGGGNGGSTFISGGSGDGAGAGGNVYVYGGLLYGVINGKIYLGTGYVGALAAKTTETNVVYYNTATGLISYGAVAAGGGSYTFADSLEETTGDVVRLDGDVASPGNYYYYGTNNTGVKSFYTILSAFAFPYSVHVIGGNQFALINDMVNPGANYFYGTNGAGTKGWYQHPLYSFINSISVSNGVVSLTNDQGFPGVSKYYGTDGSGNKGFFDLLGGSSYTFANSVMIANGVVTLNGDSSNPAAGCYYGTDMSSFRGYHKLYPDSIGVIRYDGVRFSRIMPNRGVLTSDGTDYYFTMSGTVAGTSSTLFFASINVNAILGIDPWSEPQGGAAGKMFWGTAEPTYYSSLTYNGDFRATVMRTNYLRGFPGTDKHLYILAGEGTGISGNGGDLFLRSGAAQDAGHHGDLYITPYSGQLYFGDTTFTGGAIFIQPQGSAANIQLSFTPKGTAGLILGTVQGNTALYGSSINMYSDTFEFGRTDTAGARTFTINGISATDGQILYIKGQTPNGVGILRGGDLYLSGGSGFGGGAKGLLYFHNGSSPALNARTNETNVVYYNTTTGLVTYGPSSASGSQPFQSKTFSNPLNIDCTTYKDWVCSPITGNTTINLNNTQDGDSGMFEFVMDSVGHSVWLGTMFSRGAGTFDLTPGGDNIISWRNVFGFIVYVTQPVG